MNKSVFNNMTIIWADRLFEHEQYFLDISEMASEKVDAISMVSFGRISEITALRLLSSLMLSSTIRIAYINTPPLYFELQQKKVYCKQRSGLKLLRSRQVALKALTRSNIRYKLQSDGGINGLLRQM